MANDENTAVNDLIARVGGGPLKPAIQKSSVQMSAAGNGIGTGIGHETMPASPRALANGSAPASAPHAMPVARFEGDEVRDGDAASSGIPAWSHEAPRRIDDGEHMIGTMRVSRKSHARRALRRAMPMVLVALGGVLVGAFIALRSPDVSAPAPGAPAVATPVPAVVTPAPAVVTPAPAVVTPAPAVVTPAPAVVTPAPAIVTPAPAVVTPAPIAVVAPPLTAAAPAPAVTPAAAAKPLAPGLIDVRIDTIPSGATVMLVDRGKTQLVGNTPIAAAIDPTRDYDLVFNYAGKPSKIEHLDPRITQHITVALDAAAPPSAPPRVATAPVAVVRKPVEAPSHRDARPEPVRGEGTLMISSKPPCEIVIDGRPTGLTTPQRALALAAGRHKVTLVNGDKDIKRTFSVQITANTTEKLIEDLMR